VILESADTPPRSAATSRARPVYLDNHATTRVDPQVIAAMLPFFDADYGNAASINHRYGWVAREAVERSRSDVSRLLNCPAEAIVFTSGGTEANNLALKGVMKAAGGGHLIVSAAEHRSILDPAKRLSRQACQLTVVPVDQFGQVDPQAIAAALRPETVLVSVMLANNEVGTINGLREIAETCRARDVLVHCDAVQAAGRIPVDFSELAVDLMSLSAHKLYGPKGVGAMVIRRDGRPIRLEPLFDGGGHERRMRSGTLAVASIVGFGTACRVARESLGTEPALIAGLRDRLWEGLSQRLDGLVRNGHPTERLPGNLNVSFDRVDGELLMKELTEVAVSSGSACTSADPEPSHVLRAMGIPETLSKASLRFGLGRFTTAEEIEFAMDYVATTVKRLRK
jgi:cysteine desulfurase